MKLATFTAPGSAEILAGQVVDDHVVAFASGARVVDVLGGVDDGVVGDRRWPLADVTLLAPVPEPGTVYAIGLNYAEHIAETGAQKPDAPIVFVKVRGSVAPPGG